MSKNFKDAQFHESLGFRFAKKKQSDGFELGHSCCTDFFWMQTVEIIRYRETTAGSIDIKDYDFLSLCFN